MTLFDLLPTIHATLYAAIVIIVVIVSHGISAPALCAISAGFTTARGDRDSRCRRRAVVKG